MRASKSRSTDRGFQEQSPENFWKKRLHAKTLVTTPNSDVIYAMSYLAAPAKFTWVRAILDAGIT
jgi:hypothetical protein